MSMIPPRQRTRPTFEDGKYCIFEHDADCPVAIAFLASPSLPLESPPQLHGADADRFLAHLKEKATPNAPTCASCAGLLAAVQRDGIKGCVAHGPCPRHAYVAIGVGNPSSPRKETT